MKRITKILILLLVLCMIIPCFAACNKNSGKKPAPSNTDGENNTGDQVEITTPEEGPQIEMPEKIDMDGYVYKAYVRTLAGTSPDAHSAQIANGNNDYRCIESNVYIVLVG